MQPQLMSTGEIIVTSVFWGIAVLIALAILLSIARAQGWIAGGWFAWVDGARVRRVLGFLLFAVLSHIVMLRIAPTLSSAMMGIFLLMVGSAAVAYLTWERDLLESIVYYNGVVILILVFYGMLIHAMYTSPAAADVREKVDKVRGALARPIDEYLEQQQPQQGS